MVASKAFSPEIEGNNVTVLITGTSIDGIRFETARVPGKYANLVITTRYNPERCVFHNIVGSNRFKFVQLSEEAIKKVVPSAIVRKLTLDLSVLRSFYTVVMATGDIGPFLFTNLVAPKLIASTTAAYTPRVVFISSVSHALDNGVDFNTFTQPIPMKYKTIFDLYNETKSANILTAIELSKRSRRKINAYMIYTNIIANHNEETIADFKAYGLFDENGQCNKNYVWKTIPEGAATTVAAVFDPALSELLGDNTVRLWAVTEKVIGSPSRSDPA
ncbi:hypothetical protein FB451DRAFT_1416621 [Mycena latifolia]|nr:hypothetical protein FB451DRAFT_1416621 [Mycena latifolia]